MRGQISLGRRAWAIAACVAALGAGCGEEDATSVKINLNADRSGTVSINSVSIPGQSLPTESASSGATWESRGQMSMASGRFTDVSALKVADITFEYVSGPVPMVRATLPRGAGAKWPGLLTVVSSDQRAKAVKALDPDNKSSRMGAAMKIAVTLPWKVENAWLKGRVRTVNSSYEDKVATLIVPVDIATTDGEPLEWVVTWGAAK